MSQITLSYESLEKEIIEEIDKRWIKTLATSSNNIVTARDVRFGSNELNLYFFTDSRSRKYSQLKENPNVAISSGPLTIEGIAISEGHPRKEENKELLKTFKAKQPEAYQSFNESGFFDHPNFRIVTVNPKRCVLFRQKNTDDGTQMYLDILNVEEKKAARAIITQDGYSTEAYNE